MRTVLQMELQVELRSLEELAAPGGREVADGLAWFTWKTTGLCNWLERGISIVDALGYAALPGQLPDMIELASDERSDM